MTEPADKPPPLAVHLRHDEVMAAALASKSRGRGVGDLLAWITFPLLCAAIWLGHITSFMLVQRLPFPVMVALGPWLPVLIPAVFSLFAVAVALQTEQWRAGRAFLQAMKARGVPLERDGTYHVNDEALVLETARTTLSARWGTIDTLERHDFGWIVSADQLHYLIPFAAFTDEGQQRSFLAAVTSRMTAEARARSRDAVEFAEHTPGPAPVAPRKTSPWAAAVGKTPPTPPTDSAPLPGAPEASGWLTREEANWAAGIVQSRAAALGFHAWAYPLTRMTTALICGLLVLVGFLAMFPIEVLLMRYPLQFVGIGLWVPLLAALFGLWFANRRLTVIYTKAHAEALAARGVPDQFETRWTLTATGVTYQTARFAAEAAYASVHQVLHEGGYWIIACDALTLCIPDTAFADAEAANVFMGALLARISEPARERSVMAKLPA